MAINVAKMKSTSRITLFLITPVLVVVFLERYIFGSFETSTIRTINYVLFSLLAVLAFLLGYKNHVSGEKRIVWYAFSLFLGLGSVLYIYTIQSFSNFGF